MRPRSTRFTGISGSRTVFSASITFSCSAGSPASGSGRSTSSSSCSEGSRPKSKKSLSSGTATTRLLRLDGGAAGRAVLERRLEGVPWQRRAFDPGRIGFDAGQRLEPIHVILERIRRRRRVAAGDLAVEALEERRGLGQRLALENLGHQRGRGLRDGAAAPLEAHILDALALHRHVHRHLVAAQRVMAVRDMAGMLLRAEIARPLAVIEDDVLVEIAQIHGHFVALNIVCAALIAAASASMSLSSL